MKCFLCLNIAGCINQRKGLSEDKCQTIDEVRELNREIRKHSDGLIDDMESGIRMEEKTES